MDIETIGLNIRKCRNAKKMRQEDLAQKANVSSNYISAVERGVKIPSVETLIDIMNALGVSADMIFCDVMKKKDLISAAGISSSTMAKLGKDEYVNVEVLVKICNALDANIGDIMDVIPD